MSNIGDRIKEYRKKNHLSQSEFASKLFVTKQAVSKWETGRGIPDSSIIPEIARIIDVSVDDLLGVKRRSKKSIRNILIFVFISVFLIITIPIIIKNIEDKRQFQIFKSHVETSTNILLPTKGSVVTANLDQWTSYGNALWVNEMSYLIFDENRQTNDFEQTIAMDEKWIASIDSTLIDIIPLYLKNYTVNGDYFCIYNQTYDTYNTPIINTGEQLYIFIIYQLDNNRLIFFEFMKDVNYE